MTDPHDNEMEQGVELEKTNAVLEDTQPAFEEKSGEEKKTPRRFRKSVLALVAVVLIGGGGFLYVQQANGDDETVTDEQGETADADGEEDAKGEGEGEEEEETLIPVEIASVERGSIAAYISSTANLVPEQDVKVLAEAEGRIAKLLVDEGDFVRKGQALVVLVRDDAEIGLSKAGARLANAELAYERAQRMQVQEVISSEEHDKLAMEFRVAKQEVAEAQWSLSKRTIRAPFTGQITERFVDLGQNIKSADELFTVASYDPLVARIYLPEKDVIGLEVGRDVSLALAADETVLFRGRIQKVSPMVDVSTGTVKVTIEALEKPDAVRPGGFVTVRIVRERRDDVMVVPRGAVIRELNKAHVFVSDGETATKRSVDLGMEEGELIEITTGLEHGDEVVTAGQGGLKDGDKIKVIEPAQVAVVAEGHSVRKG